MNKSTKISDYTNFEKGIETISVAKNLEKLRLPEPAKLIPSEKDVDQLTKLWKPISLESLLKTSLLPIISNRDNLTPGVYQKKLKDAKETFINLAKEQRMSGKKKTKKPFEDDPADIFEQVVADLEVLEKHQDLLTMLRNVVHLA